MLQRGGEHEFFSTVYSRASIITQKTTLAFVQIDLECFYTRDYNHDYNVYNHFNYVALLLQDEKDHAITIT